MTFVPQNRLPPPSLKVPCRVVVQWKPKQNNTDPTQQHRPRPTTLTPPLNLYDLPTSNCALHCKKDTEGSKIAPRF